MTKYNENNERIKRKYLVFLKQAKGQNEASIDAVAKAISRFEDYNQYRDFKRFHHEQAIGFKRHLVKQKHHCTGQALSMATLNSTVRHLKAFIEWLSREVGYKSRINYSDAEYFNLSDKDARIAKAKRQKPVATVAQIEHVLGVMPTDSVLSRRDRAIIAFTLLTGLRDSAIASLKLKHIDLQAGTVYQDAREVNTKFSKSFTTWFFPVDAKVLAIVSEWVEYLKTECFFGGDDPLFPKTQMGQGGDSNFQALGLSREHWATAAAIRKIFKQAFNAADLPYFNPHSFRHSLVALGERLCQTPEELKAWSQNLGHEGVLTTLYSYGEVQSGRQAEIFTRFRNPPDAVDQANTGQLSADDIAKAVVRQMAAKEAI